MYPNIYRPRPQANTIHPLYQFYPFYTDVILFAHRNNDWIFHVQYRERIIFIGDNIDEEFSNQVLASMLYLDSIDNTKKILLYINGPGGDVRTLQHHAWTFVGLSSFMLLLLFFLGEKIFGPWFCDLEATLA